MLSTLSLPCVVVSGVDPDGTTETRHSVLQLFCVHKLMAKQSVGIREPRIQLQKEILFTLFLQFWLTFYNDISNFKHLLFA